MPLFNINDTNGDSLILSEIQNKILKEFPNTRLFGAEFGVAYGGGIETICKNWGNKGFVLGFDTFTSHPKHLSYNEDSEEATAMDGWYGKLGTNNLTRVYIQSQLKKSGLSNFYLIEGEINSSSLDGIKGDFHYVFLDLDILKSMKIAYELIKNRMVKNGYLCIHDVLPKDHFGGRIYNWWYNEIMPNNNYKEITKGKHLGVYKWI